MANVKKNYRNANLTGSYSALSGVLKNRKYADRKKALAELRKLDSFQLHNPIRKKFQRRSTLVLKPYWEYGVDLMDVQNISAGQIKYILVCLDLFTRRLWTYFLKAKSAAAVVVGLENVIKQSGHAPAYLLVDQVNVML